MLPQSYIELVYDFLFKIQTQKLNPLSVTIYGSVSRGDLTIGYSDIDILYVIEDLPPDSMERQNLYRIATTLYMRYGIKIHLRIRKIKDLHTQSAGMLDCGFTSCINKLRDGVCLLGVPIDNIYMDYIESATLETINENLNQRLSKLKYDIRALTSPNSHPSNNINGYKLFTVISQLAELVAYSNGVHFLNKFSALKTAFNITSNEIFNSAYDLRLTNITMNKYFDFLCACESLIDETASGLFSKKLLTLKHIELNSLVNTCKTENSTKSYLYELVKSKGYYKEALISDNKLIINQYFNI